MEGCRRAGETRIRLLAGTDLISRARLRIISPAQTSSMSGERDLDDHKAIREPDATEQRRITALYSERVVRIRVGSCQAARDRRRRR